MCSQDVLGKERAWFKVDVKYISIPAVISEKKAVCIQLNWRLD